MITDTDIAEAKSLILEVAPELSVHPLYLLLPPAEYPLPANVDAFAREFADNVLRTHLIERGAWQGQGPTIVLASRIRRRHLLSIAIHEAGHVLPATNPIADSEPDDIDVRIDRAAQMAWAAEPVALDHYDKDHGLAFVRRAIHLAYRAAQAGVMFNTCDYAAGPYYGLSPLFMYRAALGNEPERMSGATFAQIESVRPPRKFRQLFARDMCELKENL